MGPADRREENACPRPSSSVQKMTRRRKWPHQQAGGAAPWLTADRLFHFPSLLQEAWSHRAEMPNLAQKSKEWEFSTENSLENRERGGPCGSSGERLTMPSGVRRLSSRLWARPEPSALPRPPVRSRGPSPRESHARLKYASCWTPGALTPTALGTAGRGARGWPPALPVPSPWPSAPARQRVGDRVALESKPRVSVLISAGIASLGWISKDSVTNEKHTSS